MRINENSPRKWPNSHSQKFSKILMSPPPCVLENNEAVEKFDNLTKISKKVVKF